MNKVDHNASLVSYYAGITVNRRYSSVLLLKLRQFFDDNRLPFLANIIAEEIDLIERRASG